MLFGIHGVLFGLPHMVFGVPFGLHHDSSRGLQLHPSSTEMEPTAPAASIASQSLTSKSGWLVKQGAHSGAQQMRYLWPHASRSELNAWIVVGYCAQAQRIHEFQRGEGRREGCIARTTTQAISSRRGRSAGLCSIVWCSSTMRRTTGIKMNPHRHPSS